MKKTILLLVAIFAMVACGKSDDNNNGEGTYTLRILKSEGVTVRAIVIQYANAEETDSRQRVLTEDNVIELKSAPLQIAVSGTGISDNSELTIQLLQGGEVKNQATSRGTILTASL